MAHYQAGPPPLPLGPPPQAFWQAPQAGPSHAQGYSQAPQHAGGFRGQHLGPPPPPPPQLPPAAADNRLRSVDELPACFRGVFPFRYFNAIQNECWPTIYEAGHNIVIAAPTGGGAPAGRAVLGAGHLGSTSASACPNLTLPASLPPPLSPAQAKRCCWSWPSCVCCPATSRPAAGSGRTSRAT